MIEPPVHPRLHLEHFNRSSEGRDNIELGGSEDDKSSSDILLGDILIVCAQVTTFFRVRTQPGRTTCLFFVLQVIVATQMVYEEKYVSKYNVPALQAVGWEGTFGFITLSALLIPMYFIPVGSKFGNNPRHVLEDAYDGLFQLAHNPLLLTAFCGTVVSIAFFNFAGTYGKRLQNVVTLEVGRFLSSFPHIPGISVTKEMSATTRMVLDSVRTLVIWGVSLAVGWQKFHLLQLLGFAILVTGMCVYNEIVIGETFEMTTFPVK